MKSVAQNGRDHLDDLFSLPPAQRHSRTSIGAAEAIEPSAGTLRHAVYSLLHANPQGMTDEEMQTALVMNPSTQRPRRIELVDAGFVRDSGRTRLTRSGRNAVVWEVSR
jgi:hypothetical protein